jgi:hypothetical protein
MKKLITLILCLLSISLQAQEHRSTKAKDDFKAMNPCPSTGQSQGACPDWIIDHIIALACGGEDAPSNMQWQSIDEAKAKDKWERRGCSKPHRRSSSYRGYSANNSYYLGARGGCFTYSKNGNKRYVNRAFCN